MPNPIKYSTGSESDALKKGNLYIGTGDVGKGPSDVTGYYQGVDVPSSGYTIYLYNETAPGNLSYHVANNDEELISFTNNLAGQSYTSATQCLVYYAEQTDKVVLNRDYEGIVTDGLVLNLDAGFTPSYPRSGTTFYDVGGTNNGTLTNGPTFSGDSIVFDGIDDRMILEKTIDISNSTNKGNYTIFLDFILFGPLNPQNRRAFFVSQVGDQFEFSSTAVILIRMLVDGVLGHQNVSLGTTLSLNTVQSVVITKTQSNTFTVWVNGVLTNTLTPPYKAFRIDIGSDNYPVTTTTVFDTNIRSFGGISGGFRMWNGNLFRTLVYDRVLTQQEILQNYNAQKGRFGL